MAKKLVFTTNNPSASTDYAAADGTWKTIPGGGGGGGTVISVATTAPITGGTITTSGTIGITQASGSTDGYVSATNWNTFNNKQNTVSLTTTGTSGAATFNSTTGALNIPQYSSSPVYDKSLTTYSSSGTGTQIIHNLLIPANTFGAGDILRITTRWKKVGTASASQCNVIINTSIASSGATNIKPQVIAASTVATSTQTHVGIISNTTNTQYIWNTNNQSLTDFFSNTNVFRENVATDWTTNQYIMFQCNPASTDVVSLIFYMIEKL